VRSAFAVLAATLVAVAATGCSSDDSNGSDAAATTAAEAATTTQSAETRPEPPADQSRWAQEVDEACKPWQERIAKVAPPAGSEELERYLGDTLPLIRKQVDAVDAVALPANEAEARRARLFVAGLRKLETALTHYRAALRASDAEATEQALRDANAAGLEARGAVAGLGVTQCGGYE
jgi:hypothetical protein